MGKRRQAVVWRRGFPVTTVAVLCSVMQAVLLNLLAEVRSEYSNRGRLYPQKSKGTESRGREWTQKSCQEEYSMYCELPVM